MAENVNSLGNRAIETGLRIYNRLANRKNMPTNRRIFLESVVDKSKDPITERSFTPEELEVMSNLIASRYADLAPAVREYEEYLQTQIREHNKAAAEKNTDRMLYPEALERYRADLRALQQFNKGKLTQDFLDIAGGKKEYFRSAAFRNLKNASLFNVLPSVHYGTYGVTDVSKASMWAGAGDPKESVMRTLGQFSYEIDPKTNSLVIVDKYDFNPMTPGPIPTAAQSTPPVSEIDAATLGRGEFYSPGVYGLLRQYAGNVLPPGTGRDVRIQINRLPPVAPKNSLLR